MEILHYGFIQKALVAGIMVGILCPLIGQFLVLRRLSMVGDTLAHVSLTGILLALLWGISPLPFALVLSAITSLLLEKLRELFRHYGELSLSVLMSLGLGLAVILMGLTNSSDASLSALLFGSIVTLNNSDLYLILILCLVSFALITCFYRGFFFLVYDEDAARLAGVPVHFLGHLLVLLAAVVIALGLRIVGALLVSSLMVVPVATSLLLARGFKTTLWWSMAFGVISVVTGIAASYYLDLAPGGTIVTISVLLMLLVLGLTRCRRFLSEGK